MSFRIAFVGAGPTTIYCLAALLGTRHRPASITIFERQHRAGQGTPYSPGWSDPQMLSNIASIELPPLRATLVEWLAARSDAWLAEHDIDRDAIDDRAFYPRLVLGEYLADQFATLVAEATGAGVSVDVRTRSDVDDVRVQPEAIEIVFEPPRGGTVTEAFDYVVLATGHQWPADPEIRPGYFTSPWPSSALSRIGNCAVGVRGTSLSAIDAAVALAVSHGAFKREPDGALRYAPAAGTEDFSITSLSRKGVLPEADFYHPIPYEPLAICTPDAMTRLIAAHDGDGLLDPAFELFRRELTQIDPAYAAAIGLDRLTVETFREAYFAERVAHDPFEWARRNLAEAKANNERKIVVPWRYAILRMHEVIALIVPHLSDADYARFMRSFKPVFADDYATVPHESIERLLALHAAGKLRIMALAKGAKIDTYVPGGGATVRNGGMEQHFPAFIEATGQPVLGAKDFPFPSLLREKVVQDAARPRPGAPSRGIAVDGEFRPISDSASSERLFCLSLPYLLGDHPFAQGITSSHEMGETVADAIAKAEAASLARRNRPTADRLQPV